jgi:hypothetical protein
MIQRTDASLQIGLLEGPFVDEGLGLLASRKDTKNSNGANLTTNGLIRMRKILHKVAVSQHCNRGWKVYVFFAIEL